MGELQDLTYEFRLAQYRYLGFSPIEMVVMQGARDMPTIWNAITFFKKISRIT